MNTAHERTATGKEEWLTPPDIINQLGVFDLDPCSPINRPWNTARMHYTIKHDGLSQPWAGRVFCNPPYGRKTADWLKKCAEWGDAIVLTFARTETKMFFDHVWSKADAVFFFSGRLKFYHTTGEQGDSAGAPSMLIAYGLNNVDAIRKSGLKGKLVLIDKPDRPTRSQNEGE